MRETSKYMAAKEAAATAARITPVGALSPRGASR